ncbi:hypothetical protein P7F88_02370 [Vibrio hannami]|uniref:hypothetical protein n=1 Tax=Vibrio hannami TaxID=2717094 RepID=UPI00240EEDD5|nr:hypothetical protein [Vibrio hannami]MDG3084996.1 hypothetical protein [Vibrio hannami]
MFGRLHTYWVTTVMVLALLTSSMTVSAQFMPLQLTVDSQMSGISQTIVAMDHHDTHCVPTKHIDENSSEQCCETEGITLELRCCAGSGVANYSILSHSLEIYQPPYRRNLISSEPVAHSWALTNPPFRPPIA